MESIKMLWTTHSAEIVLGIAGMQAFLLVLSLIVLIRLNGQKKTLRILSGKLEDGEKLKELLESEEFDGEDIRSYLRHLHSQTRRLKGKVGLIRYNAVGERASDMSFSLALLDEQQDGVVISSLFSSQGPSYIYAKPVQGGRSSYRLSSHEEQAIEQAMHSSQEPAPLEPSKREEPQLVTSR
ncbi:DUF4446 family protein [Paludifilum halophilum]|uniref:DUF4446 domain-containing protein n=1 Tax=Paludifilum halophilum TaxID=1642702 RepID=A0A235B7I0_9BACL|nr:DUF4446 family protein [Paludifilum halophilum]OYD07929.1 hypothetical protein CHM34_07340 [Paludifilum halophilum]